MDNLQMDQLAWLLEPDPSNPAVRYFALRELLDRGEDEPEVCQAREDIMVTGPVPAILEAQDPEGFWAKPGTGYSPKYRGTVWQVILLAELGADPAHELVRRGVEYLLDHTLDDSGAFSVYNPPRPSGVLHCLNGNLLDALINLGFEDDPRVQSALNWQVRAILGDADIRYFESGTAGPGFACGVNLGQPCGWGAVKAIKALSALPEDQRTPLVLRAIEAGVEFLFSCDPAAADYPYTKRVSSSWFKLGFPLSYWSDVLETTTVLVDLGYGRDPRLGNAIQFILDKQDGQGRWRLENSLNGKMWVDIEKRGKPSKWITLRALRALKKVQESWPMSSR